MLLDRWLLSGLVGALVATCVITACNQPRANSTPPAEGPIVVGKGAGESEFSVIFAHTHLNEIIGRCLVTCSLLPEESQLLAEVQNKPRPRPVFRSARELGVQRFRRNPEEIWFNQDTLWLDSQKTRAYDIGQASALWLEVLVPTAETRAEVLQQVQTKLAGNVGAETQFVKFKLRESSEFAVLLWKREARAMGSDRLFVVDSDSSVRELTEKIKAAVPGRALKLFKVAWIASASDSAASALHLEIAVSWVNESDLPARGHLDLTFPLLKRDEALVVDHERISVLLTEE